MKTFSQITIGDSIYKIEVDYSNKLTRYYLTETLVLGIALNKHDNSIRINPSERYIDRQDVLVKSKNYDDTFLDEFYSCKEAANIGLANYIVSKINDIEKAIHQKQNEIKEIRMANYEVLNYIEQPIP